MNESRDNGPNDTLETFIFTANKKRAALIARLSENAISSGSTETYLGNFEPELLESEEKIADSASFIFKNLIMDMREAGVQETTEIKDCLDIPPQEKYDDEKNKKMRENFRNKISKLRTAAMLEWILLGRDPFESTKRALLEGIADYFAVSTEEVPQEFRFLVAKIREEDTKLKAELDMIPEKDRAMLMMKSRQKAIEDIRKNHPGIHLRIAENIVDTNLKANEDGSEQGRIAKQILADYPDLDILVELVLGTKNGILPIALKAVAIS